MTVENYHTYPDSHLFEVVFKQFLDMVHGTECDLQGTYTIPSAAPEEGAYTVEVTVEPTADSHCREIRHSYCLDCEWSVSTAEFPEQEVSSQVVHHAVETGHDIDSSYLEVGADDTGDGRSEL